jgi:hypothetical protein
VLTTNSRMCAVKPVHAMAKLSLGLLPISHLLSELFLSSHEVGFGDV